MSFTRTAFGGMKLVKKNKAISPEEDARMQGDNWKRAMFKLIDADSDDFKKRNYYLFYRLTNNQCILQKIFDFKIELTNVYSLEKPETL
jgi:hypothetical protein